ncbi:hypothetical protein NDU88_004508 [Pleurodeles waltl]|uniref:Uncharacterized protein n=1 Tax=Pleurodeles waltl TaxID=8319 RepID=A0AAV7LLY1_PLEWA|nr:hypothetical protein NDU88_004508 [Pleurodeles waltl]
MLRGARQQQRLDRVYRAKPYGTSSLQDSLTGCSVTALLHSEPWLTNSALLASALTAASPSHPARSGALQDMRSLDSLALSNALCQQEATPQGLSAAFLKFWESAWLF